MQTLRLRAEDHQDVLQAAAMLREGATVAFPTETVYGLGANALDAAAVEQIFAAKQRPHWDPLIVHLAESEQLQAVASLTGELRHRVEQLSKQFWPGPLTLLVPRLDVVPDVVTARRPLVGVRVPRHPAAQALLRAAGVPVAAPSANRFGHISPTTAEHVLADLDGRVGAVLDGGPCTVGVESTVIDPAPTPMVLYRAGGVTAEGLQAITGVATAWYRPQPQLRSAAAPESLPSPGVGLRHYAPRVPVVLSEGSEQGLQGTVRAQAGRVGVLLPLGWLPPKETQVESWGDWGNASSLARNLFAGLRALEACGVEVIVCPLPPSGELGEALRDRLLKAAMPDEKSS